MSTELHPVRWIDSTSWELPFYGLPSHIPWPATVDAAIANREPFEVEHLLNAIEALGTAATEPWLTFLKASDHFADLLEALEDNDIPSALDALDAIDDLMPETAFSLFHRAFIARREGSDDDALELYQTAAEKAPQVAAIWTNLGSLHMVREEREEAIKAFRKAIEVQPGERNAMEGLVSMGELVKLRSADPRQPDAVRFIEVETFQQIALQQVDSITDPEALFTYGEQLLREGTALEAATRAFERSSELRPAQPKVMHALATAYRMTDRVPNAREILTRYTQMYPQDPNGFLHLAQTCNMLSDEPAELAALDAALQLDPNAQPALVGRFRLSQGEHDPAKEDELSKFATERDSWMAHLLAGIVARTRGDHKASLRHVQKAFGLQPENEEVLIHYATALADRKEIASIASIIRPAVESGRYSKRLDWHYANVLRQLGLTKDAIGILEKALQGEVPDEFRNMVLTTIDAWKSRITGSGIPLEIIGENFLQRPIVITLPDGDGGVLVAGGSQLPQEAKFPWRATGPKVGVRLQQGESGGTREPDDLGHFVMRGVEGNAPIECHLVALPDGAIHFRATQNNRKLEVGWTEKPNY